MNSPEMSHDFALQIASQRLDENGFSHRSIGEHQLPVVEYAHDGENAPVEYVSFGNVEAPNVILNAAPMFTKLTDHYKLRLSAQQTALGDDYRVIGVQAFDPHTSGAFDKQDMRALAAGSFKPLSARILRAAKSAGVTDEQSVLTAGYSLGADVAVETAHDVLLNENRGVINVEGLSAVEFARAMKRGRIAMLKAFADSGNDLITNVLLSDVAALDEAWGVDRSDDKSTKSALNGRVNKDLISYVRANIGLNKAILGGFATETSTRQIDHLLANTALPVLVANQERSKVCPTSVLDELAASHDRRDNVHFLTEAGDHSADDDIRKSAGRILYFAGLVR